MIYIKKLNHMIKSTFFAFGSDMSSKDEYLATIIIFNPS